MKKRSFKRHFLLLILVVLLTLTACERPVPREDTTPVAEPAATSDVIIIPTAPPEGSDAIEPTADAGQTTGGVTEPAVTEETTETGDTAVPPEETPAAETTDDQTAVEAGEEVTHVVQSGETLGSIAQFYHVSVEDIAAANNIADVDVLEVGQSLIIRAGAASETGTTTETTPPTETSGEQVHVVQAGENLFRIGLRYGFTPEELAAYNNIPDITRIDAGQIIKIPPK